MFTRSKQNANEAQLQFRRENPITLCGRIAHTAWLKRDAVPTLDNANEGMQIENSPSDRERRKVLNL